MRPWQHAQTSAGTDGDWMADLPIHEFLDSTKVGWPNVRHRMILHNADLGPELAARAFPGRSDVKAVALGHIAQDFKDIPALADWLARCDPGKFPKPLPDHPPLEALPARMAAFFGVEESEPRKVLELLLLPVEIAGPDAQCVLFNAIGPALVRHILGPPRLVPGADGGLAMFEPGQCAEKMIQQVYGTIPTVQDVTGAVGKVPTLMSEAG